MTTTNADMGGAPSGEHVGVGYRAPAVAGLFGLAATPTFAVMAVWTGLFSARLDLLCSTGGGISALNGMVLMYALMGFFHAAPWLRLMSDHRNAGHRH